MSAQPPFGPASMNLMRLVGHTDAVAKLGLAVCASADVALIPVNPSAQHTAATLHVTDV